MVVGRWVEYKGWKVWVEDAWIGVRSNFLVEAEGIYKSGWLTKLGVEGETSNEPNPKRRQTVKS